MVWLVAIAHDAVVTGGLTLLLRSRCAATISPSIRIEMAQFEGRTRNLVERARVVNEAPKYACSSLRGLIEQNGLAFVDVGKWLSSELAVLQLVGDLDCVLEGRLERCNHDGSKYSDRLYEQSVLAVLDERDNTPCQRADGIVVSVFGVRLLVSRPISPFYIKDKSDFAITPATLPTAVDPPDCRGMTVCELGYRASGAVNS